MKRKVFFSFHFANDFWRVQQVRNIGSIEGNQVVTNNSWEEIKRSGDNAIKRWIDQNLEGKTCLIVLIGSETANRKWINYEIESAYKKGMAIIGIHIYGLKCNNGMISKKGNNPFNYIFIDGKQISNQISIYEPLNLGSQFVYKWITDNLSIWIEEGINLKRRRWL